MLRTIRFDDQPSANAKEVDDVRADRDLPAKLQSAEAPKAKLGVGRDATHGAGASALGRRNALISLHDKPLIRPRFARPPSP
jgi:hypothetical protein